MMDLQTALATLPQEGLTVKALKALDYVAPGAWSNPTGLDAMIGELTGASGEQLEWVRARASELFLSPDEAFGEVYGVFQQVDQLDRMQLARSARERLPVLAVVDAFVPHVAVSQELDAALKVMGEALTFAMLRETGRGELGAFVKALRGRDYDGAGMIRMVAWVAFEGLLPFGVEFMPRIVAGVEAIPDVELARNALFVRLARLAPGGTPADKRAYLMRVLEAIAPWAEETVSRYGLTQDAISSRVAGWYARIGGGAEALGLAMDSMSDYISHTGAQTVAHVAIQRAWAELQGERRPSGEEGGGARWVAVGRDASPGVNHIVLDAPQVSGQHLIAFEQGEGAWLVRDLGSTNGTFVVGAGGVTPLLQGSVGGEDVLLLGSYRLPVARLAEALEGARAPGRAEPVIALKRCERAWMQLICIAAIADDHLGGDEKGELLRIAATFPSLLETPERWVVHQLRRTLHDIRARGYRAVLRDAAAALGEVDEAGDGARQEALRLAARVARAEEGGEEREARFLDRLARSLELPQEAYQAALDEADAAPTLEMAIPEG